MWSLDFWVGVAVGLVIYGPLIWERVQRHRQHAAPSAAAAGEEGEQDV